MIQYYCTNHGDNELEVIDFKEKNLKGVAFEERECSVCHSRDHIVVQSQLYWCDECGIPLYKDECTCCGEKARPFTKDVRPVFPEEKILLEILMDEPAGTFDECSIWNGSGNAYYKDGKRMRLSIKNLRKLDVAYIRAEYCVRKQGMNEDYFHKMINKFIRANEERFHEFDTKALNYIQDETREFDLNEMFISFSGGKDSTVVADLVNRSMSSNKVMHIFGDTTLEFPGTYEYVQRYKKEHPKTPVLSARNKDKDFYELCELLGPPSRVMRWCCTIFKTGAINRKIDSLFRRKKRMIAFQGIRRSESVSRSKYEKKSSNSKIAKQITIAPIIDWFDFDVWLYLLTRNIDFNDAYRLGFARVGCWCCPNNSDWSQFLSMVHMPDEYYQFREQLIEFAKSVGKPDPEVYVDEGWWKARQGGNGVDYAKNTVVSFEPCVKEDNAYNYELTRPISENIYELFKPFGKLNYEMGNKRLGEVYVLDDDNVPILSLRGRLGQTTLRVNVLNLHKLKLQSFHRAKEIMDCQITKYQMCMGCKACESVCKFDAISVKEINNETIYSIDEKRCVRCRECINHFTGGCYMRKVLAVKR